MTFQAQASIPYFTMIPEDVVTNVFSFNWVGVGTPGSPDFINLTNSIAAFYEDVFPESGAITMAAWASPSNFRVRIYDLDDTPPRVPHSDIVTALTVEQAASGTTPPEVAVCLSFHAAVTSGTNPARRRGRIYLGALGAAVGQGDPDQFPVPAEGLRTNLAEAAENLLASAAGNSWEWCVWSPTDSFGYPIVGGWIDNAFDTQRRRGNSATSRLIWPA